MGLTKWCGLNQESRLFILTNTERMPLAEKLKAEVGREVREIQICNDELTNEYLEECLVFQENDLILTLFSIRSYAGGLNKTFSPFKKPNGLQAKYRNP